jgi:Tol biopolymer transport system component
MIAPHTRLGPYEVLAPLGAGGMGEVYRARDSRLGREVALKFLPESVAADESRLSRFEREAKLLASLSHSGVATLYGFEQLEGKPVLVMEVVEGPTLADRIQRGGLPWREAVEIGRHIAEALEAAHEAGIVHRDLKPSNIKLSADGRVKLLDFGLGKAIGAKSAASEAKLLTETSPTDIGIILGTAPYMSPEQARGEPVDDRSDIWAFGCVLYEMLTGKRAFPGPTASDVVVAILDREPDWGALPHHTPPPVRSLLRRCLTKDPFRRLHSIADARIELEEALTAHSVETRLSASASRWSIAAAVTLALAVGATTAWRRSRVAPATRHAPTRFNIAVARGTELTRDPGVPSIALSPDGRHLIYAAHRGGLYIRSLDGVEARPLAGAENGWQPFLSPDGRWIGFTADGKMQKVSLEGGSPRPIVAVTNPRGASWGEDGSIVYTPDPWSGLHRVSAEGGTPQKLTEPDPGVGQSHRWPQILPRGGSVLYTIHGTRVDDARIAVLSLETGMRKVIVEGGTYGRYVPTGHLVYASGGSIFAAPFDVHQAALTGAAVPVVADVRMDSRQGRGGAQFDFSTGGTLAYIVPHERPTETHLLWVDRKGSGMRVPGAPHSFANASLSSDGQRLIVSSREPNGASNLWLYDRGRQTWTQLTFERNNNFPEWSPRGDRFAFDSNREGPSNLFVMPADGGLATRLTTSNYPQRPTGWSPDGNVLFFEEQTAATDWDLWELSLGADRLPRPLVVAEGSQWSAKLSPDGRWLAYMSDETGRFEVYVRPYRGSDRRWTLSTHGGGDPVWSRTGREIYYSTDVGAPGFPSAGTSKVWVVPVTLTPAFRPGKPRVLFEREKTLFDFDAVPDGEHFVIVEAASAVRERLEIVLIPNWFEELKAKVPVSR